MKKILISFLLILFLSSLGISNTFSYSSDPEKFISVKGIQALGKQLSNKSIKEFSLINNETNYDNKAEEINLNKNDDQDSNNNKQITMKFD